MHACILVLTIPAESKSFMRSDGLCMLLSLTTVRVVYWNLSIIQGKYLRWWLYYFPPRHETLWRAVFRDSIVNKARDVTSDYHKTRSKYVLRGGARARTYGMEVEIILKNWYKLFSAIMQAHKTHFMAHVVLERGGNT